LNREICSQQNASQILQLFSTRKEAFININLVTALHRLGRCRDRIDKAEFFARADFTDLLQMIHTRITDLEPHHLTNTAWALAKLGFDDGPLLDAISAASQPKMADAGPPELAFTPWAFASLI
jgi:hypothetical protein